jgi:hypothetical protein
MDGRRYGVEVSTMTVAILWLATAAIMIWRNQSRSSLVMAGVMLGWSSWILMDAYLPLFLQQVGWAYHWFNVVGLGGFMLIVGSITVAMIWILDRW